MMSGWLNDIEQKKKEREKEAAEAKAKAQRKERERLAQLEREAEHERIVAARRARGTRLWASGSSYQDSLLEKFDDEVTCLALGVDGGYFMVKESGRYSYWGIPTKLSTEVDRKTVYRPTFVALGAKDRYYVKYNDGTSSWSVTHSFSKAIHAKKSSSVKLVVIGGGKEYEESSECDSCDSDQWDYSVWVCSDCGEENCHNVDDFDHACDNCGESRSEDDRRRVTVTRSAPVSWFIQWTDGSWQSSGLSKRLLDILNGRWGNYKGGKKDLSFATVKFLSLADDNTYFVRFGDGCCQWCASTISESLSSKIAKLNTKSVEFGTHSIWALRYNH